MNIEENSLAPNVWSLTSEDFETLTEKEDFLQREIYRNVGESGHINNVCYQGSLETLKSLRKGILSSDGTIHRYQWTRAVINSIANRKSPLAGDFLDFIYGPDSGEDVCPWVGEGMDMPTTVAATLGNLSFLEYVWTHQEHLSKKLGMPKESFWDPEILAVYSQYLEKL